MCGIVAIFAYRAAAPGVSESELLTIRDAMRPRGPDGEGLWLSADGRVGLAHRRLAILDLSDAGAQPMRLDDDPLSPRITFNGEIYNYRELREELEAQGSRFRSTSDTEVLLHLYRRDGAAMVERLRGMYAFVIWDPRQRRVFAARDPFGIKPLYYADDGRTIRLASQVKALLAGGSIDTTSEPAGHAGFFVFGHVPEPFTLYKGIRSLPAGGVLTVDDGGQPSERQAIDIIDALVAAEANAGATPTGDGAIAAALADSVRAHLVADVEVGAFLSAGKDSTTIVALAAKGGQKLNTLTLGFAEFAGTGNNEVPLAEEVAHRFSAVHRTVRISQLKLKRMKAEPKASGIASDASRYRHECMSPLAFSLSEKTKIRRYVEFRDGMPALNLSACPGTVVAVRACFADGGQCYVYPARLKRPTGFPSVHCDGDTADFLPLKRMVDACVGCGHQLSVIAGTAIEQSTKPLALWFRAILEVTASKQRISTAELHGKPDPGSCQAAWSRVQDIPSATVRPIRDPLSGDVDVDESYVNGLEPSKPGRAFEKKAIVAGAIEKRGQSCGRARLGLLTSVPVSALIGFVQTHVDENAPRHTDGWCGYADLSKMAYQHIGCVLSQLDQAAAEVLPRAHLIFPLLKRRIRGTHKGFVSLKHLPGYIEEFTFPLNYRRAQRITHGAERLLGIPMLTLPRLLWMIVGRPPSLATARFTVVA